MIKIPAPLLREIYDQTKASYPNECCGVMVGTTDEDKTHTVHAFRVCKNLNQERARDRYDMDPLDMLRVEREFENSPWDIIGIYHSHPDHPAQWSQTDFAEAHWLGCSYVITSVEKGKAVLTNSFELTGTDESDKQLVDEKIDVV